LQGTTLQGTNKNYLLYYFTCTIWCQGEPEKNTPYKHHEQTA